jgi:hypothetical protein
MAKAEKAASARRLELLHKYGVAIAFWVARQHAEHYRQQREVYDTLPKESSRKPTGPRWTKEQYREAMEAELTGQVSPTKKTPTETSRRRPTKVRTVKSDFQQQRLNELEDAKRLDDETRNELWELTELIRVDRSDLAERLKVAVFRRDDWTDQQKADVVAGIAEELERGQPFPNAKRRGKNKGKSDRPPRPSKTARIDPDQEDYLITVSDAVRRSDINAGTISRAVNKGLIKSNGEKGPGRRLYSKSFDEYARQRRKLQEAADRILKKHAIK